MANGASLARQTQDMIEVLGEEQLKKVFSFTASLIENDNSPYNAVTKGQVLEDIRVSKAEFITGKGQDAKEAVSDIRAEFEI